MNEFYIRRLRALKVLLNLNLKNVSAKQDKIFKSFVILKHKKSRGDMAPSKGSLSIK